MKYCKWHDNLIRSYMDWILDHEKQICTACNQIYSCCDDYSFESLSAHQIFERTFNVMDELLEYYRWEHSVIKEVKFDGKTNNEKQSFDKDDQTKH